MTDLKLSQSGGMDVVCLWSPFRIPVAVVAKQQVGTSYECSSAAQARRYAFKCHRKSDVGKDKVYPVNSIAFHPIFGTFASGRVCR